MLNIRPDLPKGNLYEQLEGQMEDPDSGRVVAAVREAFLRQKVPKELWTIMGNAVIRFAAVVLLNGDFTIDENDMQIVNLKRLGDEFFTQLGDRTSLSRIIGQSGGK